MTHYRLHDDLSLCKPNEHLIFLDIQNDQYFRLPATMEGTLIAYLQGTPIHAKDIGPLIERNILVEEKVKVGVPAFTFTEPVNSLMEQTRSTNLRAANLLEVAATVCWMRLQLAARPLKRILESLSKYRERNTSGATQSSCEASMQSLQEAAMSFMRVRLYVPIETSCLLDSLAMVIFLARRGMYSEIVFGVVDVPFSAHCWVQVRELVLNDTVGNAKAHTPIRVI